MRRSLWLAHPMLAGSALPNRHGLWEKGEQFLSVLKSWTGSNILSGQLTLCHLSDLDQDIVVRMEMWPLGLDLDREETIVIM